MLVRLSLLLAAAAVSLSTAACSSLTRPDEVVIVAEAPAPTTIKQLPAMQVQGAKAPAPGGARPQPAAAPALPGACGD